METLYIEPAKLKQSLQRNEAFWNNQLEDYPLLWITVPNARPGKTIPEPATEDELWTDVDYVIEAAENQLACTHFGGDALPTHNPWLGPDQFSAWLGAEMKLMPRDFTSWVKPFVKDWREFPDFKIDMNNRWWKLYLEILRRSAEYGKDKWITCYPDLHTGIDALGAIRGQENLMIDMISNPEPILRAMEQMTQLWKDIVDITSDIIMPAGQGTSNWTGGWSEKRFLCIGQFDFTCMISPQMFKDFCYRDFKETCDYVDVSLLHLDGPGCARHIDKMLETESLDSVQWIQGAGNPTPIHWLDLLKKIEQAGKSIQLFYEPTHGGDADIFNELDVLCTHLNPKRLFFYIITDSVEKSDAIVKHAQKLCFGSK